MTYQAAIVGVMARKDQAWHVANATDASFMAIDDGTIGPGANHLRAWHWLKNYNDEPWSLVLEDDAVPIKDFQDQAHMALETAPSPIVSFYLGRVHPRHWQDSFARSVVQEEPWLTAPTLFHHVAVAMKTSLVPVMLDAVSPLITEQRIPIDEAIGHWTQRHNIEVSYTNPSLVEHDWKLPTTIVDRDHIAIDDRPRRAWHTGGREEWTSDSYRIPGLTQLSNGKYITAL